MSYIFTDFLLSSSSGAFPGSDLDDRSWQRPGRNQPDPHPGGCLKRHEHFLSFLLKMTVAFASYATAKKQSFSQKLPSSTAVTLHLYIHRGLFAFINRSFAALCSHVELVGEFHLNQPHAAVLVPSKMLYSHTHAHRRKPMGVLSI